MSIGHVNEYPTMHHFGNPIHIQSMIAYDFDCVFLEIPVKNCIVEMLLTCPVMMESSLLCRCYIECFNSPLLATVHRLIASLCTVIILFSLLYCFLQVIGWLTTLPSISSAWASHILYTASLRLSSTAPRSADFQSGRNQLEWRQLKS